MFTSDELPADRIVWRVDLLWLQKHGVAMKAKNPAAVALGSIKSERKAATARENGKKGGRPKKPASRTT